jgi:hypothetical protein
MRARRLAKKTSTGDDGDIFDVGFSGRGFVNRGVSGYLPTADPNSPPCAPPLVIYSSRTISSEKGT